MIDRPSQGQAAGRRRQMAARTAGLALFSSSMVVAGFLAGAPAAHAATANAQTQTFSYTGSEQYWTVPADVYSLDVQAVGGSGQAGQGVNGASGGAGGYAAVVTETIAVSPGQMLGIDVGGDGDHGGSATHGLYSGPGGGGSNPFITNNGGQGGGATGVWIGSTADYVAIAGGGGGGGGSGFVSGYTGGNGGSGGQLGYGGGGGSGPGSGSGGSGDQAYTNGAGGGTSTIYTYGGGGGGGGGGWNGTVGGGYGGSAGQAGGGGGGGAAGGASLAAVSSATVAIAPSYGDGSVTLTWTTGETATENLAVTPNPAVTGQKVTFTDTITPSVSGTPAPTGAVTFQEYNVTTGASTNLATVPVINGVATWTTSSLPAGTHSITPIYSGDAVYFPVYVGYTDVTIGQAAQALTLTPAALAFGNQTVNTTASQTVTLTDTGTVPWTFASASTSSTTMNLAGGTCTTSTVQPGGSCTLQIAFKPVTAGAQSGTVTIRSNFAAPASISITGTGVAGQAVNTPAVTSVSPGYGPAAGGTKVTITGTNLTQVTGISFGGTQATSFSCPSSTTCTAVSPAGFSTVHVHVTNSAGTSPKNAADHFAYQ